MLVGFFPFTSVTDYVGTVKNINYYTIRLLLYCWHCKEYKLLKDYCYTVGTLKNMNY